MMPNPWKRYADELRAALDRSYADPRRHEYPEELRVVAEEIDERYRAAIELFEEYEAERAVIGPLPFPS